MKLMYPGMRIKRWFFLFAGGVVAAGFSLALLVNYRFIGLFEGNLFWVVYRITGNYYGWMPTLVGAVVLCGGLGAMGYAVRRIIRSIVDAVAPEGANRLVDIMYQKRRLDKGPSVVVIGGGTGLSTLLRGLKRRTGNLTAIVTVADDGGSSGRLRNELGIVPPGDLRSCLVALADTEPLMEKLFQYRFIGVGELAGHSFGNLFIAAMMQVVGGDVEKALQESSKVLAVRGQVLPASATPVKLSAEMTDGTVVNGESEISGACKHIRRIKLDPPDVPAVKSAIDAILAADIVVLGPGSLYTSVIPNLLVREIADALRKTKAERLYVCNVMTQPGETDRYTASDHVQALFEHGGAGIVDCVLVNVESIDSCLLDHYAKGGACPVEADIGELERMGVRVIPAPLISKSNWVRHDPIRLAKLVFSTLEQRRNKKGQLENGDKE
jgi:uncharacterized cofD-like protein